MKVRTLRLVVPLLVLVVLGVGLALNHGTGTLSAFGWRDVSLLCPLGALTSMIAAKTIVPRAVAALAVVVVIVLLTGRAFCSWACPVPLVSRLRYAFTRKGRSRQELESASAGVHSEDDVTVVAADADSSGSGSRLPLTEDEQNLLRGGTQAGCAACTRRLARFDSRHIVLGTSVLTAAIFGFPVFCLVCPIGLTFGTVLLVIALFGYGDVTWSVVLIPALLLAEVVFFRKWCSAICPMGALIGLIGRANRTARPSIDKDVCLETTTDAQCGACTRACDQGINMRNPQLGASAGECTRCLACVEACPTQAVSLRALVRNQHKDP